MHKVEENIDLINRNAEINYFESTEKEIKVNDLKKSSEIPHDNIQDNKDNKKEEKIVKKVGQDYNKSKKQIKNRQYFRKKTFVA